jgi:hypothetical protein
MFLLILVLLSAIVYQRSGKVLFLSKSKNLSYSEKAIRTQLFLLSKIMVCSIVTIGAAIITQLRIDTDFIYKLYIPTLFFLFWFILYKIEPRAFYNIYSEGEDCGYNTSMFSDTKCKHQLIKLLLTGIVLASLSTLVTPVYDAMSFDNARYETLLHIKNYLNQAPLTTDILIYKMLLMPNASFVFIFGIFCIMVCISNVIGNIINTRNFIKKNKQKITKFLRILTFTISARKLFINSIIGGFFSIIVLYDAQLYRYVRVKSMNLQDTNIMLPKLLVSNDLLDIISIIVCVVLIIYTIITIIKLLMLYSYQTNIIYCNRKQAKLKLSESSKYADYNFFEKLVDYQTILTRYIYDPKSLLNKKAVRQSLAEYMNYINYLGPYRRTIFLGAPLALTGSLCAAIACYRIQLKACSK